MNTTEDATPSTEATTGRIQLSDGFSVTREFFDSLHVFIEMRLQELQHGRYYNAKQLAGKAYWALLSHGDQRLAGRCIAKMVARDLLPLTFVQGKHEYPLRYELK